MISFNPPDLSRIFADLKSLALTLSCAAACGLLARYLGLPAPYMLGSMIGLWIFTASAKPLQGYLLVPRWFHKTVVLGVGVISARCSVPKRSRKC